MTTFIVVVYLLVAAVLFINHVAMCKRNGEKFAGIDLAAITFSIALWPVILFAVLVGLVVVYLKPKLDIVAKFIFALFEEVPDEDHHGDWNNDIT